MKPILLLLLLVPCLLIGGEARRLPLLRLDAGPGKRASLEFPSSPDSYYLLRASGVLFSWSPRALKLGSGGPLVLEAPAPDVSKKGFYIVEEIPRAAPRDTDGDGIDDVYELEHPSILDPLKSTDASLDPNGDGITHLEEYLRLRGNVTSSSALKAVSIRRDDAGTVVVRYTSDLDHYYILEQSRDLLDWQHVALDLGAAALGELETRPPAEPFMFFRVKAVPKAQPLDLDGDGINDFYELLFRGILNPLNPSDAVVDHDGNGKTNLQEFQAAYSFPTTISSSPADGETGVATTRETIIRFSSRIADTYAINDTNFFATYGGEKLPARIHLSPDRDTITLFYDSPLPPSARIRVHFDGNVVRDGFWRLIDADGDGVAGGVAQIEFETLTVTTLPGTAVCGRVFASEPAANQGGGFVNCPLAGVKITVDGRESELFTITDQFGNFRLEPAPVGRFFVHVDGRTATNPTIPAGAYYPFVGKAWETTAGVEVTVGNIYLPLVAAGTLSATSPTDASLVKFPASVINQRPEYSQVSISVPADALFSDDGTRGGQIGIAPVDPQRLPGQLPPGLNLPLVITVQTNGPTNFDQPIPATFPNLPDPTTGLRLPPGAKTALWSFNHDTGMFEVVGPMTVSADGLMATTDPGVGIRAPGWHGTAPGTSGGGSAPGPPGCCKNNGGPPGTQKQCPKNEGPTDPVALATGEFYQEETDMTIKGRGIDFHWSRRYASREGKLTAMGHGWDVNYNVGLQKSGRVMELAAGDATSDMFQECLPGVYERREFFANITEAGGKCELLFPDQSKFKFKPFDNSPLSGKVEKMSDRFGNEMTLSYSPDGRLTTITDTLGRPIQIGYNADGFISTVTDFTGRQVRYEYYGANEAGGSFGDLKSVTTPAVTGTPNGNDFPDGKKRTYTYTKGFADERLNHNLLTITDGRRNDPADPTFGAGPFVVNTYSPVLNEANINFDRVTRQVWGGDVIDFHYEELTPLDDRQPTHLVILNDRNGNVTEHYFNALNHKVRELTYTGRSDPRQATTRTANRPTNKLRATDPDFYETVWEINDDSLIAAVVHPNGNREENIYESDLTPTVEARFRGNLRQHILRPGPLGGDQVARTESFEYNADFGCPGCGFNFVTRHTDFRGNVTVSQYDPKGNLTQRTGREAAIVENWEFNPFGQTTAHIRPDNGAGHRRRDVMTYYSTGPQAGYLKDEIVDATGFAYATTYEHDARGNVTRITDPRGHDQLITYNQLDQVVATRSAEVTPGSGVRYEVRTWFDANNNVTRTDTENRDAAGVLDAANPWFTVTREYEITDHLIRTTQEVTPTHHVVTEMAYDKNRNQTLTRYGEATAGRQQANTLNVVFDERNLPFRQTMAAGHPAQSTTQMDYDPNGNLVRQHHGLEDQPRVTLFAYDGYDRRVRKTDPMGNVCTYRFDANGNMTRDLCQGELIDVLGSVGNVRLADTSWVFDVEDRTTQEIREFFKTADQSPILDGQSITTTVWTPHSQAASRTNDNNHTTTFAYDTAGRLRLSTDAKGNTVTTSYDGNNNRLTAVEVEKSDLGTPDETFTTTFAYDGLNRPISVTDNVGNISRSGYDSRSNRTVTIDGRGNRIEYRHDGLSRLLETDRFMTTTGDGSGVVNDHILTKQYFDDSSRLVGQEDDNGNLTSYEFDPLNRKTADVFADTTRWEFRYNVHHTEIGRTDANQNVVTCTVDLNDRVTRKDIVVGPGVSDDTTFEVYKFDGLNRLVHGEDNDSVVLRTYDSLSNVLQDIQNGTIVAAGFDGVGNQTTLVYPGGRVVSTTYDDLERKKVISDPSGQIAEYFFTGPGRVARRTNGNGTRCDYSFNGITGIPNAPGDRGVKRMTRTKYLRSADNLILDDRTYSWDAAGNKTSENDIRPDGPLLNQLYSYDAVNRLIRSERQTGATMEATVYELDGVGNRIRVTTGGVVENYTMDATLPGVADRQMNQYTSVLPEK